MGQWADLAKGIGSAVKQYVTAAKDVVVNTVYSDLSKDYAGRAGTEITNLLQTGNAYGPGSSMAPTIDEQTKGEAIEAASPGKDMPPYNPADYGRESPAKGQERGMSR